MTGYPRSALNAYTKQALENEVSSASPHKLILMLYDGALTSISMARTQMEAKDIAAKGNSLSKAISIIEEGLRLSLDKNIGGELALNLDALYEYMSHRLLAANIGNDVMALDEVSTLLNQLRSAWVQIAPGANQPESSPPSGGQPNGERGALSYGKA